MNGDILELLDDRAQPVLTMSRITASGLENREWSIVQYFDGTKLVTVPPIAEITFINNAVWGGTGCCGLMGRYSLSGTHLRLSHLICVSGGWCPAEYEPHTTPILDALREPLTVEPDGQRMILRDDRGTVQIVLRPRDR